MTQRQRIAAALALIALAMWLRGGVPIGRDIADDGLYVLVVEDIANPGATTPEQGAVINSVRLVQAVEAAGGQYRKQDISDDMSGTGVWEQLRSKITEAPSMAIAKGGRVRVESVPATIEKAEAWIK